MALIDETLLNDYPEIVELIENGPGYTAGFSDALQVVKVELERLLRSQGDDPKGNIVKLRAIRQEAWDMGQQATMTIDWIWQQYLMRQSDLPHAFTMYYQRVRDFQPE